MPDSRTALKSVERAMAILRAFSNLGPELSLSELARHVGLAKSVVHRSLSTLVDTGFLVQDATTHRYRIGPESLALGLAALSTEDLPHLAQPYMEDIRSQTRETSTLSLLVGNQRVYASQLESPQDVRMTVEVGTKRWPLYAGSSGRAVLAGFTQEQLDEYLASVQLSPLTQSTIASKSALMDSLSVVRDLGYAVSAGERDPWAASVASPIFGRRGKVLGAISVCGPIFRFTPDLIHGYGKLVKSSADAISGTLAVHARPAARELKASAPERGN